MRDIKFRGKSIEDGSWVYGDLETRPAQEIMVIHQYNDDGTYKGQVKVEQDSVGQFTGLNDNFGNEIYDGDILRVPGNDCYNELVGVAEFERGAFLVRSINSGSVSDLAWCVRDRMLGCPKAAIIGNVSDNPEMLGGRDVR